MDITVHMVYIYTGEHIHGVEASFPTSNLSDTLRISLSLEQVRSGCSFVKQLASSP